VKKFITLLLFFALILSTAQARPVHTYKTTTPISDSVSLTRVEEFYPGYNMSYSYIKADLTDDDTSLELLKPSAIDKLDTVGNIVSQNSNVVGALNADFFSNTKWNGALSIGLEIKDGKLLQSPINPDTMATVAYDGKALDMNYLNFEINVVAPNGEKHLVRHLNKHTEYYGDILMYTPDFNGGNSPAPGGEVCEVVVSDGKLVEFRRKMPSVKIPENGYVLVVSEGVSMFLANNFSVGDPVEIEYSISPSLQNAKDAFGGGSFLVKDGVALKEFTHVISGNNPRSAIGTDKNGTTVYLVALDGRQEGSRGMSMSEMAQLMQSLGCYTAVNLDGGGSTNMVASTLWEPGVHTVNKPTENRKVINAVGITHTAKPGTPEGIEIQTSAESVYKGQKVTVKAAVYDENMRPLNASLNWSATGGTVENGVFTAKTEGKAVIRAEGAGIVSEKEIYVFDKLAGIELQGYLSLDAGTSTTLPMRVFDSKGNVATITDPEGFEIKSSDSTVVSVKGLTLTAHRNGRAVISVSKDGLTSYLSVISGGKGLSANPVGEKEATYIPIDNNMYLPLKTNEKSRGSFRVSTLSQGTKTLMREKVNADVKQAVKMADSHSLIGSGEALGITEDSNALYIRLDTSKGGIRATDSNQWTNIVNSVSSTDKKDIFILSDKTVFGSSSFENRVFKDYFGSLQGKNVWVITPGDRNMYLNDGGVHYFTVANNQKEDLTAQHVRNYRYLEFTFGEITSFEWKKLY